MRLPVNSKVERKKQRVSVVLVRIYIAVNRHYGLCNSDKGKCLIKGFCLSSWQGAWWHAGRCGDGGVDESATSFRQQQIHWDTGQYPEHNRTLSPPLWHTSSNKAIPTPAKLQILILPPSMRLWKPVTTTLPSHTSQLLCGLSVSISLGNIAPLLSSFSH